MDSPRGMVRRAARRDVFISSAQRIRRELFEVLTSRQKTDDSRERNRGVLCAENAPSVENTNGCRLDGLECRTRNGRTMSTYHGQTSPSSVHAATCARAHREDARKCAVTSAPVTCWYAFDKQCERSIADTSLQFKAISRPSVFHAHALHAHMTNVR